MPTLSALDYLVFVFYFAVVAAYGWWVYRRKRAASASASQDYFLAEGALTWWAIGASLIASNISAEQFIGMSGAGFKLGLAIASYEWMAAATLLVVALFFMPVYLKNRIVTMPQFLRRRYDERVATIMAVFWLLLYVVVNLTSILYLGALAINSISGVPIAGCMLLLALFAVVITLGGMKVIGYTDAIQVLFLVAGGLVTTYLALDMVAARYGASGALQGLALLGRHADDHLHLILRPGHPGFPDLPGLTVLVGDMWIANLNYWGCNQYITQRALGADLQTARAGLLFAAFLKLLMPLIVVVPGIAAYVLHQGGAFQAGMLQDGAVNPDRAYPVLLNLLPSGLKGVAFAALTAAVVASLAGKANSIATIFTLDIYRDKLRPQASEAELVRTGKLAVVGAMLLAIAIAPLLGIDKKGGFQYIQEYTGFVSPGVFAMFLLGFFWKRATANAALFATLGGFGLSLLLKFLPLAADLSWLIPTGYAVAGPGGVAEIPFLDRMMIVFVLCTLGMVLISLADTGAGSPPAALRIEPALFRPDRRFAAGAVVVLALLVAIYSYWW